VQVPQLTHPSLLEAEATMVQVAKRVMNDPRLFALKVTFNNGLPLRVPNDSRFTMSADYESPCDQVNYLRAMRWWNLKNYPEDSAQLAETPFLPPYSCWGNPPAFPPVQTPAPELESNHPPVEGWKLDLPQLLEIAKSHQALFANGLERFTITTVTRIREDDSKPQCGQGTVFNPPPSRDGMVTPIKPAKRLLDEPGQRAVIELVEHAIDTPQPGSSSKNKNCAEGHYLIIDARSGADLESGTYLSCMSPVA
jgi:hypothetical protein